MAKLAVELGAGETTIHYLRGRDEVQEPPAHQVRPRGWFRQGVALRWLPPYNSELKLIEIFWSEIKQEWLLAKTYSSFDHLKAEPQNILDQFGSKYRITFK